MRYDDDNDNDDNDDDDDDKEEERTLEDSFSSPCVSCWVGCNAVASNCVTGRFVLDN